MRYIITGSGGREHALAWKLSQSKEVEKIYCMPGNAGTAHTPNCTNIGVMSIPTLVAWAKENKIDRLMVGSEDMLVAGIVDIFAQHGIEAIGPHKEAAQLEGSKSFAKAFMMKHGIRTAQYHTFAELGQAKKYIDSAPCPLVIKADGLASGKGVLICQDYSEAKSALFSIMQQKVFGEAGDKIVVEEFLSGFETSILAFYDGKNIIPMLSAKDHKKIFDGEKGKNTGGMGAIAPNPLFTQSHYDDFMQNILKPTQLGLEKEKLNFKGIIFFGLMIQQDKCYLLEYNTRFGDPELQPLLTLLESDLHQHFNDMMSGSLSEHALKWHNKQACCVVLASGGYPDEYEKNKEITIPQGLASSVFTAGVKLGEIKNNDTDLKISHTPSTEASNYIWLTDGGRVLNVVGLGKNLAEARECAYNDIAQIHFDKMYYRKDIGHDIS